MASVLPMRPNTNSTGSNNTSSGPSHRRPSLASFPSSKHSQDGGHIRRPSHTSAISSPHSHTSFSATQQPLVQRQHRHIKSQYPRNSEEKHVEYILVAKFDIDKGSIMEHQYPGPVGGDEHMLAELMLPDQVHVRSQDWTIFFLHKDGGAEDEDGQDPSTKRKRRRKRKVEQDGQAVAGAGAGDETNGHVEDLDEEEMTDDEDDEEDELLEHLDGPPLVYVLNLVNTKKDDTVNRGAVVRAMAICTRHSFLHIYKPLLLIALEEYFRAPVPETLASLYEAVNAMDLSLMPRLSFFERFILQSSDKKDLFIEKFEAIVAQGMAANENPPASPTTTAAGRNRYGLPRDTHEFESVVRYANIPVPVKIPVALSPEVVGDFSLIKLITTFSTPHTSAQQPFVPTHPHLTTSGPLTHPIIVLLNALLTQKRVIFLGHNLPSSDVAEAVLGACALASGGMLRGFTRHAFPYTDLTKIDDLLKVPGFIAGVTNPAFAHKNEWWDLLCDLSTGRMRISTKVEQAPLTEGVVYFQQQGPNGAVNAQGGISAIAAAGATLSAGLGGNTVPTGSLSGDATHDAAFMTSVLHAINERHGENAIRSKFRLWVLKFTRLAAAFEETVYGASALHIHAPISSPTAPFASADSPAVESPGMKPPEPPAEVAGHGYVWPSNATKNVELAANATRIESWRNTRSYYNFIQDLAAFYVHRPVKSLDLQHLHDKLAKLRLGHEQSANIYIAICTAVSTDQEICQLLSVVANGTWDSKGGVQGGGGQGLFYLALGLFHPKREVREAIGDLLFRIQEHEAGRHFWAGLGRFARVAWDRVMAARLDGEYDG